MYVVPNLRKIFKNIMRCWFNHGMPSFLDAYDLRGNFYWTWALKLNNIKQKDNRRIFIELNCEKLLRFYLFNSALYCS